MSQRFGWFGTVGIIHARIPTSGPGPEASFPMDSMRVLETLSDARVESDAQRVWDAVDRLFGAGTIATLSDEPRPILIGELQWIDDGGLMLFTAHGDALSDVHRLMFDDVMINPRGSVTFLRDGHVVGALHAIDDADVADPDDYRIAWQLWQEIAPLRRDFIARCFATVVAGG